MFAIIKKAWQKFQDMRRKRRDKKIALEEAERRKPIRQYIDNFKSGGAISELQSAASHKNADWKDRTEIASLFKEWAKKRFDEDWPIEDLISEIPTYQWLGTRIKLSDCHTHIVNMYYARLEVANYRSDITCVSKLLIAMSEGDVRRPVLQAVLNKLVEEQMDQGKPVQ